MQAVNNYPCPSALSTRSSALFRRHPAAARRREADSFHAINRAAGDVALGDTRLGTYGASSVTNTRPRTWAHPAGGAVLAVVVRPGRHPGQHGTEMSSLWPHPPPQANRVLSTGWRAGPSSSEVVVVSRNLKVGSTVCGRSLPLGGMSIGLGCGDVSKPAHRCDGYSAGGGKSRSRPAPRSTCRCRRQRRRLPSLRTVSPAPSPSPSPTRTTLLPAERDALAAQAAS